MILIIDNYDSFTYNLVNLVALHTDEFKVIRNDALSLSEIQELNPDGILISPGPGHPSFAGVTEKVIADLGPRIPLLGVCLGHQAIGNVFGAKIMRAPKPMHGKVSTISHDGNGVFSALPQNFTATRYHSLIISEDGLPAELHVSARSDDGVIQGVRHKTYPVEGIQFHPESILTSYGPQIISNWIHQNKAHYASAKA